MRGMRIGWLALALLAPVQFAAAEPAPPCPAGLDPVSVAELLFGRNINGRHGVTDAKWARFLEQEITPRFPDGLTVYDARGQWRDSATGRIARERSKIVMIVLSGQPTDRDRLEQVAKTYAKRFSQQSVGLVIRPSCAAFIKP